MKKLLVLAVASALAIGSAAFGWAAGGPMAAWLYTRAHKSALVHPQAVPPAPAPLPEVWVSMTIITVDGEPLSLLFTSNYGHQTAVSPADCAAVPECMQAAKELSAAHHATRLALNLGKTQV